MNNAQAINIAAQTGDTEQVNALLAADPTLVSAHGDDGWTPLHLAFYFGHQATAEALLAQGADVHAWTTNDLVNQPIHAATAGQHYDAVALLLAHGAAVDTRQHGGWVPLHGAADDGRDDLILLLLEHGADVNAANDTGQTALSLAQAANHPETVALLRAHGATG